MAVASIGRFFTNIVMELQKARCSVNRYLPAGDKKSEPLCLWCDVNAKVFLDLPGGGVYGLSPFPTNSSFCHPSLKTTLSVDAGVQYGTTIRQHYSKVVSWRHAYPVLLHILHFMNIGGRYQPRCFAVVFLKLEHDCI